MWIYPSSVIAYIVWGLRIYWGWRHHVGRAFGPLTHLPKDRRPPDGDTPGKEPRGARCSQRGGMKDLLGTGQSINHIG